MKTVREKSSWLSAPNAFHSWFTTVAKQTDRNERQCVKRSQWEGRISIRPPSEWDKGSSRVLRFYARKRSSNWVYWRSREGRLKWMDLQHNSNSTFCSERPTSQPLLERHSGNHGIGSNWTTLYDALRFHHLPKRKGICFRRRNQRCRRRSAAYMRQTREWSALQSRKWQLIGKQSMIPRRITRPS